MGGRDTLGEERGGGGGERLCEEMRRESRAKEIQSNANRMPITVQREETINKNKRESKKEIMKERE